MALDFPASPTNGQTYGAYVYDSSLPGWRSKGGAVAATYVSDTAPSGAVKGDMWYRSSDGTTYVYYVDADTSQWVEIRSEIATSKVGLVPILPTSITTAYGTASVAADGTISLVSASEVSFNGIFSDKYRNYRIMFETKNATGVSQWVGARLKTDSTVDSAGVYYSLFMTVNQSAGPTREYLAAGSYAKIFPQGDSGSANPYDIFSPNIVGRTRGTGLHHRSDSGGTIEGGFASFEVATTTQYTGLFLFGTSYVMTGVVKIYGYN